MLSRLFKILPWLLSAGALYVVLHDIDWAILSRHITSADRSLLVSAVLLTIISYLLRSYRWIFLFPERTLTFLNSNKVLILGFFMNNILPARTGELVRAHVGAKISGQKRTLVLATVASERLADGLMLSLMFVAAGTSGLEGDISKNLLWVAGLFGFVGVGVVVTLGIRRKIFAYAERLSDRLNHKSWTYALSRLEVFIDGLAPLFSWSRAPMLAGGTMIVWFTELLIYALIATAFNHPLSFSHCIVFLVTVNFSSLIPAAPGGIGVIEGVATFVLVSLGIPKEIALSMVICQHAMQYLVVGIPGAYVMFTWKQALKEMNDSRAATAPGAQSEPIG